MSSWIKEVPLAQLQDGQTYFLAKKWESGCAGTSYVFHSQLLNGKVQWSSKPGIAIRCVANEKLRAILAERADCVAIEIPADADKRGKARKRRF